MPLPGLDCLARCFWMELMLGFVVALLIPSVLVILAPGDLVGLAVRLGALVVVAALLLIVHFA